MRKDTALFIIFLKDLGIFDRVVALTVNSTRSTQESIINGDWWIHGALSYLTMSFTFDETTEGDDYWWEIHRKWDKYYELNK